MTEAPFKEPAKKLGFYVVGIGASAGGLEALEQMFQVMPCDSGMAFVIVQHLSPDFKSLMSELLARYTDMPIHRVVDGMQVERNSLYLIPPNQEMIIADGKLLLTERDSDQPLALPIDHFFRSLAQDLGDKSIAVILSGTGSDGSRGLRDVHEVGGLVISQSLESAKFDGMPRSAVDTGLIDVALTPDQIPQTLARYSAYPLRSQLAAPPIDESNMEHIFRLLLERYRIDFNIYKPATIGRRIERRIQLNHLEDIDEYVQRLESNPNEVELLHKDLLIGVTQFFRDQEAFDMLRYEIMDSLLQEGEQTEEFRVWVTACATGEEAYSVAIVIAECLQELNSNRRVKIFATDVNQASIDFAHAGHYPASSLEDVEPSRRKKFFTKTKSGYRVAPDIRHMIVFAPHNLVDDAPFTRLNLVTCRNALIYFKAIAQKKVLSLFHFGLKTGGVAFLGASESTGELSDEFEVLHQKWKFFRKRKNIRFSPDFRMPLATGGSESLTPARIKSHPVVTSGSELSNTYDELLERYMPAGVLVDQDKNVLHIFAGAGEFLSYRDGRTSHNLLEMLDGDLKLAVAGGLQRVIKEGKPVSSPRVVIPGPPQRYLRIDISPFRKRGLHPKYLITFEELEAPQEPSSDNLEPLKLDEASRSWLTELEQELRYTKENLQSTIEELETSNEELQATNEELVASNEELQSTNEELHSVNEELYTVNAEYQLKISELTELSNDMDNLLVSTEVHTLFLDENLCIRKFTPKMADVFNLVMHDIGRRIDAFSNNIDCTSLIDTVTQVLDQDKPHEERVQDNHGNCFLMRVLPYHSSEETNGVVLTLIDISLLVEAQENALREQELFERAVAANRDGTWDWVDVKQDSMWWTSSCYTLLGFEPDEFPASRLAWLRLIHPDDQHKVRETSIPDIQKCYVEMHREFEYRMRTKSGEYRWFRHRAIVDYDDDGNLARMTGSVRDVHDRKVAELKNLDEIQRRDSFLAMLSHELRNPMGAALNAIDYDNRDEANEETKTEDSQNPKVTKIVERQLKHMARLLDDLLDVARLGQSKIEFRQEVVDLSKLAPDVIEAVAHEIKAKHQTLHTNIATKDANVFADPARIRQAQVNLLTNASKYSPNGAEIWYEIELENDEVLVTVRDTGDGIAEDQIDKIFELFLQGERTLARSAGGMGVGLSLTRSVVEAHAGTIVARSGGVGKGSTFIIRLPHTKQAPPQPKPSAPVFSFHNCKLLLVEDNEDARTMLAKTLRYKGFDVACAGDGRSALDLLATFQPRIALVDIGLPTMNGYEFARAARKTSIGTQTALIALTGYGRDEDQKNAVKAGFDAHLVKPLDSELLYSLISTMLMNDLDKQRHGKKRKPFSAPNIGADASTLKE